MSTTTTTTTTQASTTVKTESTVSTASSTSTSTSTTPTTPSKHKHNLPEVEDWPHRPIYLQATTGVAPPETQQQQQQQAPLPLGVPFAIESSVFRGQALVRLRHAPSDDPETNQEYFGFGHNNNNNGGNNRRRQRVWQIVLQGQFTQPVRMDEMYVGSVYNAPLQMAPPAWVEKIVLALMRRLAPGLVMNLSNDEPYMFGLLAGSGQAIRIDTPGQEPDIKTDMNIVENFREMLDVSSSGSSSSSSSPSTSTTSTKPGKKNKHPIKIKSVEHRRKVMSCPQKAAQYTYNPDYVYTFEVYDSKLDLAKYTMALPVLGNMDMIKIMGQALTWGILTKKKKDNQNENSPASSSSSSALTDFERALHLVFWHEKLLQAEDAQENHQQKSDNA